VSTTPAHEETDMPHLARTVAAIALAAAALAACTPTSAAPPAEPAVDAARATEIVERAFRGYNDGDYATWTADWSTAMTDAIKEADFLAAREQLMATYGRYVSAGAPTLSSKVPGTYRWTFPVTFEKRAGTFWVAFYDGSSSVDGVRFE
jgi:hypothetical protein